MPCEWRRKIIEYMPGVAVARQQKNRLAGSAPIKNFEANSRLYLDEQNFMRRGIAPRLLCACSAKAESNQKQPYGNRNGTTMRRHVLELAILVLI